PDNEWRMPILIVSSARAAIEDSAAAPSASAPSAPVTKRLVNNISHPVSIERTRDCAPTRAPRGRKARAIRYPVSTGPDRAQDAPRDYYLGAFLAILARVWP